MPARGGFYTNSFAVWLSSLTAYYFLHATVPIVREELAAARLACIRHAASVHPEPGSNSP